MAGAPLRPRRCKSGQGDSAHDVTSAFELTDFLARRQPIAGSVLTICAEDMDQWIGSTFNDQPLWLVDGSGTVHEHGPIQCGLVLYVRGELRQSHSAAFMPGGGLHGTWKMERYRGGGSRLKRKMEISSSAVEELCHAWALDFYIGRQTADGMVIVVDNLHWLPALCGIADPSPTTMYSRSIVAECVCRQGGFFFLRNAIPCMDKKIWGKRKHHTSWPADQAALMAHLDHRLTAPARAFAEARDTVGPRGPRIVGVHGDIDPRAWGRHVDIVRLVRTGKGTKPGNHCPGDLLGVLVRVVDHYPGHRGTWLEPLAPPFHSGPRQHMEAELASMAEVLQMHQDFPPAVTDTWRTAQKGHTPERCELYFVANTAPNEAVYSRAAAKPRGVKFGTFHKQAHKTFEAPQLSSSSHGPAGNGVGPEPKAASTGSVAPGYSDDDPAAAAHRDSSLDSEDDAEMESAKDLEAEVFMAQRSSDAEDHLAHQSLVDEGAVDDMNQGPLEAFALDQLLEQRQTAAAHLHVMDNPGTEQALLPAPDPALYVAWATRTA